MHCWRYGPNSSRSPRTTPSNACGNPTAPLGKAPTPLHTFHTHRYNELLQTAPTDALEYVATYGRYVYGLRFGSTADAASHTPHLPQVSSVLLYSMCTAERINEAALWLRSLKSVREVVLSHTVRCAALGDEMDRLMHGWCSCNPNPNSNPNQHRDPNPNPNPNPTAWPKTQIDSAAYV